MNFVWKQVLVALAVLAALVVGGCGGDDESDGGDEPEAEALSVEEYTTETDEVLMTFGEESISLGTELQSAETAEEAQAGVEELDTLTQTAVDDLNAIEPPEEAAEGHESLVTALEGYLADIETLGEGLSSDDPQAVQEAVLAFQEAGQTVIADLQTAAEQLQEAGIAPPEAGAGG